MLFRSEIRFYVDGCLRNRIVEGQTVKYWDSGANAMVARPFRIPKNQELSLIIGNPASNAGYLPDWYRAWTNKSGSGTEGNGGAAFKPTELHADYVRYYTSPDLPAPAASLRRAPPPGASRTTEPARGPWHRPR